MFLKRFIRFLGLTLVALALCVERGKADASESHVPKQADSFVDSIGVNLNLYHATYGPDAGSTIFDSQVRPALQELGVRYIRDTIGYGTFDSYFHRYANKLKALSDDGIKMMLIAMPSNQDNFDPHTDSVLQMNRLRLLINGGVANTRTYPGGAAIYAVQITNEIDHIASFQTECGDETPIPSTLCDGHPASQCWYYKVNFCRPNWFSQLSGFVSELSTSIKADAATQGVQVIAGSLVHLDAYDEITTSGPSTLAADYATLLSYFDQGSDNSYGWGKGAYYRVIPYGVATREVAYPGKMLTLSEFGYYTLGNDISDTNVVTPVVQSKYLIRAYADFFNRGTIDKEYLYTLYDLNPSPTNKESSFGIIGASGPKPGFYTLRNAIRILKDPGEEFTPVNFSFGFLNTPASIHSTVLQKRNGDNYLLLWNEENASSNDSDRSQSATIEIPSAKQIDVFRPSVSDSPIQTLGESSGITLSVPDDLMILKFSPVVPTPTPTATPENRAPGDNPTPTPEADSACRIQLKVSKDKGMLLYTAIVLKVDSNLPLKNSSVMFEKRNEQKRTEWKMIASRRSNAKGVVKYSIRRDRAPLLIRVKSSQCISRSIRRR